MKKFSIFLLVVSLISVTVFAYSPSDWAKGYIDKGEKVGITNTDLKWQEYITREQYCELLYNTITVLKNPNWSLYTENPFLDTENYKVIALKNYGVVEGISKTEFFPEGLLTREEAATLLCRVYEKYNDKTEIVFCEYADEDLISCWSFEDICKITELGIMEGVGDNKFAPQENYTIEQAITTLVRLMDLLNTEKELNFADEMNTYMPKDKNYMFSPLSVKLAFLLAANGAEGETLDEVLDTFEIDDLEKANEEARAMIDKYSKTDLLRLDIANSIWINSDESPSDFNKEYKEKVKDLLDAESRTVNNNNAVETINNWVNEKTNKKIPSIIDDSGFASALVNAIYFKGAWEIKFNKGATKKDEFTSRNGEKTEIDFMRNTEHYNYCSKNNMQIIELPYTTSRDIFDDEGRYIKTEYLDDTRVSMYVIMSDDEYNPVEAIENAAFSDEFILLYMPKFKTEYSKELSEIIRKMGINAAFKGGFGKMFDIGDMYISKVLHKTYIDVDEDGTEAAAVTAILMKATGAFLEPAPEPITVKFNKPFTYVIKDKVNGEILFVGQYAFAE